VWTYNNKSESLMYATLCKMRRGMLKRCFTRLLLVGLKGRNFPAEQRQP